VQRGRDVPHRRGNIGEGREDPPLFARSSANSSAVGGISGVLRTETSTEPIEQTAPSMNEPKTQ
jgi:hypothetical protein